MRIHLDMDEVVADWHAGAEAIIGKPMEKGIMLDHADWAKIRNSKRMFRDLPIRPGAIQLVNAVTQYVHSHPTADLVFLTAIPPSNDMPFVYYDKVQWAMEHFPHIPVLFGPHSYEKLYHCTAGDILIDDREDNIEQWQSRGGLGHIYTTWENCKPWLEETLQWKI